MTIKNTNFILLVSTVLLFTFFSIKGFSQTGEADLNIANRHISWLITNNTSDPLVLDSISFTWPEEYGSLRKINLRGLVQTGNYPAPSIDLKSSDLRRARNRTIQSGESNNLRFEFTRRYRQAAPEDISITVSFTDGTVLVFGESEEVFGSGTEPLILPDGSESTVGTVDTNVNRLWDEYEVRVGIVESPGSVEYNAVIQAIIATQEVLLFGAGETDRTLQEVGNQMKDASRCLVGKYGEEVSRIRSELELITINTLARSQAQQEFDRASVGQLFSATTTGDACE